MRSWLRKPLGATLAAAAVLVTSVAVTVPLVTGGGGGATANLWVDTTGGTCARQPTAGAYSDPAACGTLDAAWDAATAGDLICVKPGTYTGQNITGDKASETTIRGCEGGATFTPPDGADPCPIKTGEVQFQGATICASGNFMTLRDVTIDTGNSHGNSVTMQANGHNTTLRNIAMHGPFASFWAQGDNFAWSGGELGAEGVPPGQRQNGGACGNGDGEPIEVDGDTNLIENITVWPQGSDQTPTTCSSNGFHLENIRVQSAPNTTIRNVYFEPGSEAGSGHIFWSGAESATGQVIEGSYFGALTDGATAAQNSNTLASCVFTWRYNTFTSGLAFSPSAPCSTNGTWTGNLGTFHCGGTHANNVWYGASSCGGDTTVSGTFSNLGLSATGRPQAGSPAIDAGQATCSSLPFDHDGIARPLGSACDAGAFEYAGG